MQSPPRVEACQAGCGLGNGVQQQELRAARLSTPYAYTGPLGLRRRDIDRIGIFFGTETGTTRLVAKKIHAWLGDGRITESPHEMMRHATQS